MPSAAASRAVASLLRQRRSPPPCNAPHRLLRRRAPCPRPAPLAELPPTHSGCPLSARGCFASHSPQPRSRALHPAVAAPPPCRPAPSRNAHDPIAPYVWPPPFLALGGAPMPPRPLAASASALFSPKARAAATRPSRWGHVRSPPSAGQSRRQRVHNTHAPPLGAFLPPIRDAPCLHGGVLPRTCPQPRGRTLHPAADIGGQPRHYAAAANHRASDRHAPPLGAFLPPIRGVSFTSHRSLKRWDGKID